MRFKTEDLRLPKKVKILTVKEFIEIGETEKSLGVTTFKNGSVRCEHNGPVSDIKIEQGEHHKKLSWSDSDGDPVVCINSMEDKMEYMADFSDDEFKYLVTIKKDK